MTTNGKILGVLIVSICASAWHGCASRTSSAEEGPVYCQGEYSRHLQGVASDGESIYWSFTTEIVRTDLNGRKLAGCTAPSHQGDLCVKDGVVYVAVNRGRFNQENEAVSEVSSYDAKTLRHLKTWPLPDMPHGAGGMTCKGDRFYVVGGLPATHECNYVYEYTGDFKLVKRHELKTGFTLMGIQTAAYIDGKFYFGIYGGKGNPSGVLEVSSDFVSCERFRGLGSYGIYKRNGRIYAGGADHVSDGKVQLGYVRPYDNLCARSMLYAPARNGGRVRIFFAGRDGGKYEDCGYRLRPDGYRPLTQHHDVFRPVGEPEGGKTPAVLVDRSVGFSVPDLVRGVHRAASENESLAFAFPGTGESASQDEKLSPALDAIVREARLLGVELLGY